MDAMKTHFETIAEDTYFEAVKAWKTTLQDLRATLSHVSMRVI